MSARQTNTHPRPPHPGSYLRDWLHEAGRSQKEFAAEISIRPPLLNMILNGNRNISSAVRPLIAKATGIPEPEWVRWEKLYEEASEIAAVSGEHLAAVMPGTLSNGDMERVFRSQGVVIEGTADWALQECSVDLTLGESRRLPLPAWLTSKTDSDGETEAIRERSIVIHPGESWTIWAKQRVAFSRHYYGRLGGMSEMTLHGLLVSCGLQINPGWAGRPFIGLFNPTGEKYEIPLGEPVMSLEIHALGTPANITDSDGGFEHE